MSLFEKIIWHLFKIRRALLIFSNIREARFVWVSYRRVGRTYYWKLNMFMRDNLYREDGRFFDGDSCLQTTIITTQYWLDRKRKLRMDCVWKMNGTRFNIEGML